MEKIYIENIAPHAGKEVTINGWLYNKRSSGKLHFLLVRDGTGIIQVVISKSDVAVYGCGFSVDVSVYDCSQFQFVGSLFTTGGMYLQNVTNFEIDQLRGDPRLSYLRFHGCSDGTLSEGLFRMSNGEILFESCNNIEIENNLVLNIEQTLN